jgi:hypothetical protein
MLVLQHSSEQNHHNEFQQDVNLADSHSDDFCSDECRSTNKTDSKETKHPHDYDQNDIQHNDTWYNNTHGIKTLEIDTRKKL